MKPNVVEELLGVTRPTLLKMVDDYNINVKKTSAGNNFNWSNITQIYQKRFFPKFKKNFVLSILQNKGGVGKTTSVINLGWLFSQIGNTLLIDLDGQGNLSKSFEIYKTKDDITLKDILDKPEYIDNGVENISNNLDIIPNITAFDYWKRNAYTKRNVAYLLKKAINPIRKKYDFILIDFPPAMDIAFDLGLYASDYALIVSEPEPFSDDNIENVMAEIKRLVDDDITGLLDLNVLGIFITQFKNVILMKDIYKNTKDTFEVFNTHIRDNIQIPESQAKREPIFLYNENCNGSQDYFKLWVEIMEKING